MRRQAGGLSWHLSKQFFYQYLEMPTLKHARILMGIAILAAAFPVGAAPAPVESAKASAKASPARFQAALEKAIKEEVKAQGSYWLRTHPERKDADDLDEKFHDPEGSTATVPLAFLKGAWPLAKLRESGAEPPGGWLMFTKDIPDFATGDPGAFLEQFNRYLGSLGVRNDGYRYLEAAHATDKDAEAAGLAMQKLFGGTEKDWKPAAKAARDGIRQMIQRFVPILVDYVGQAAKRVEASKASASDRDQELGSVIMRLHENLEREKDPLEQLILMNSLVDPTMPLVTGSSKAKGGKK